MPLDSASANGTISGTVNENETLTLTAPQGYKIGGIQFASYGTPVNYQIGSCHASNSFAKVEQAISNESLSIAATNDVFGDPCVGVGKRLSVVLVIEPLVVQRSLASPTNLQGQIDGSTATVSWSAPVEGNTPVERYAIFWSYNNWSSGFAIASTTLSASISNIPAETQVQIKVRADNDSFAVYSGWSNEINLQVTATPSPSTAPTPQPSPQPESSPEPSPSPSPEPTVSPSPTPSEPTPTPSPEPQPTSEPTPSPTPSPQPSVTPIPQPEPNPQPSPSIIEPIPLPSTNPSTEPIQTEEMPILNPILEPEPSLNPEDSPSLDPENLPTLEPFEEPVIPPFETPTEIDPISQTPEQLPLETSEIVEEILSDILDGGDITPADAEEIIDALSADGEVTQDEVNNLSEQLSEDGTFTESERELVAEALIESADGEAVTVEAIAEAGITLEDLPPATPIEVREDENGNAVIISAVVADALQLLESPAEILSAIFESPAELVFALGNLGADMSEEERDEATKTIVAATIVGNIAATASMTASLGSVGYRRKP